MTYSSFMGQTFTKLFSSITDSTIWGEPDHVRLVWITMLASADHPGRVYASIPGLADKSRVDRDLCIKAIERLSSPDPWSRTKVAEGRRIEEIDGGWRLINYKKYREFRDQESIKESKRDWWHKNRGLESKLEKLDPTRPHSNQEEVEEEVEEEKKKKEKTSSPSVRPASREVEEMKQNLDLFETHIWKPYPKRKSRTGLPCGKGHKPDAIQKCLAVKRQWGISWSELQQTVEMYHKFPNLQEGNVQAVEVFFGEKGHWLECWQKVKQQQPQLIEEKV